MTSAELFGKIVEEIHRQYRSGLLTADYFLKRNCIGLLHKTAKACVIVTCHGDDQPLAVNQSIGGEFHLVTSWSRTPESSVSELIEDKKRLTISDAVSKLQQILHSNV